MDRPGGAGVRGDVQHPDLCLVTWLTDHRRAAVDLVDQSRGELPGDVAVRAAIVYVPAGIGEAVVHGGVLFSPAAEGYSGTSRSLSGCS